jgi:Septum formation
MPPPPGQSGELPPGYLTDEAKAKRTRSARRRGRLSIGIGVLVLIVAVLATLAITAQGNEETSVADIDVGDCFNGDANDLDVVECAEPHAAELFAVVPAADASVPYPGAELARTDGGNACALQLVAYYGAETGVAAGNGLELSPIAPSQEQWDDGDTETYCLAVSADGGSLQGSVHGQGAG